MDINNSLINQKPGLGATTTTVAVGTTRTDAKITKYTQKTTASEIALLKTQQFQTVHLINVLIQNTFTTVFSTSSAPKMQMFKAVGRYSTVHLPFTCTSNIYYTY